MLETGDRKDMNVKRIFWPVVAVFGVLEQDVVKYRNKTLSEHFFALVLSFRQSSNGSTFYVSLGGEANIVVNIDTSVRRAMTIGTI